MWRRNCRSIDFQALDIDIIHIIGQCSASKCDIYWTDLSSIHDHRHLSVQHKNTDAWVLGEWMNVFVIQPSAPLNLVWHFCKGRWEKPFQNNCQHGAEAAWNFDAKQRGAHKRTATKSTNNNIDNSYHRIRSTQTHAHILSANLLLFVWLLDGKIKAKYKINVRIGLFLL